MDIDQLRAVVAKSTGIKADKITNRAHFYDELEFDSLASVELAIFLEKETDLSISDEELRSINNLEELHHFLSSKAV